MSDLDACSLCGLCKANCRVYRIMLTESKGPRGKSILLKNKRDDDVLYMCTLCRACKQKCPLDVDLPDEILEGRRRLIKAGKQSKANKKMIENVRKYGNPFGKIKQGEKPKELYCC